MNKRGLYLVWDASFGVIAVIAIIVISAFFAMGSETAFWPSLQITRTANDIITNMRHNGLVQSLNETAIKDTLNELLGKNYEMVLVIEELEYAGEEFSIVNTMAIGNKTSKNIAIASGKRKLVSLSEDGMNFFIVRFWIWLK